MSDDQNGPDGAADAAPRVSDGPATWPISHVALLTDWRAAQAVGRYEVSSRGVTLADEGFVHTSFDHQVAGVLRRYYDDLDEPLVLLHLDRAALGDLVVVEPIATGELFAHVYGPVPVGAVLDVEPLVRTTDPDGEARWHRSR